jgi:spermidine synthase
VSRHSSRSRDDADGLSPEDTVPTGTGPASPGPPAPSGSRDGVRPAGATAAGRRERTLALLVFGAGTGTLATEIAASRLLAPYYGSSTIVWANLIGLVLLALSLGYWIGGRVSDRRPEPRLLGQLVVGSGLLVAAIPFVTDPILGVAAEGLDELSAGAVVGSFFAVLLLFAPPVFLLGMVSPFAIRLAVRDVATAGQTAGRLYALSTAGSLLGTFLTALVLIPLIGTQRTLLASAAVLVLSGSLLLGRRWLLLGGAVAALLAVPPGAIRAGEGLVYETESRYQFVRVTEQDGVRRLYLNEGVAVHSVWRAETVLTGGVWDTFLALPTLLERPPRSLAVLGNAGGTVARAFGSFYPGVEVDGVEIDPAVTDVAYRWFGLGDNPRVRTFDEDARPFLRRVDRRYDLVYVDAYHQPYVPFYLATREFFELVRARLAPGGLVALNVASVPGDEALLDGLAGTLADVFPEVRVWPALRFNQLLVGLTAPPASRDAPDARLEPLVDLLRRDLSGPVEPAGDPWTDDHAPVEWVTDQMIIRYAVEGGGFDETPLPTAPDG